MSEQNELKLAIKAFLVDRGMEETYHHCVAVGEYAAQLGKRYLREPEKARIAGYLHDISAVYPNEQRIEAAEAFGIELNDAERAFPLIIHQKLSRKLAVEKFSITDEEILSAIECHTTLKGNYSDLDLVLFVADKIKWDQAGEPPYLGGLLNALEISLEKAAFYYIDYILTHDIKVIHPWLEAAYIQLQAKSQPTNG